jgi:hypothetical protein
VLGRVGGCLPGPEAGRWARGEGGAGGGGGAGRLPAWTETGLLAHCWDCCAALHCADSPWRCPAAAADACLPAWPAAERSGHPRNHREAAGAAGCAHPAHGRHPGAVRCPAMPEDACNTMYSTTACVR